jgi:hypothetical protein
MRRRAMEDEWICKREESQDAGLNKKRRRRERNKP